jgi:phenylalanyl-tRNA synthetase beta chain
MNVPLNWLSEYVDLPESERVLTDKLTSIGHMLDKTNKVGNETIIDLELRGNRADMFGLIGVAREVSAAFNTKHKLPPAAALPKTDSKSLLIHAEKSVSGLVKRYMAVKLAVIVGPSPKWLADRLVSYGIPALNNVIDVTNYVMVETSHPMHAFDFDRLNGHKLTLRLANQGEKFDTIQQGTTLSLSSEDLAIADDSTVQCLNIIGGFDTRITDTTGHIILETAVYDSGSVRKTARRHKVFTEGGSRHEKYQDPEELPFTLARAVYLLKEIASANVESEVSDYYPHPTIQKTIDFDFSEINRLTGINVPDSEIKSILTRLEFTVSDHQITVPSFRTDVRESADLVEEVIRIYGYDNIPAVPLSGPMPSPQSYPSSVIQEHLRQCLTSLGLSEIITLPMISNNYAANNSIRLINPPDPDRATLRRSLIPSLMEHAIKLQNRQQLNVAIFEIGKVFYLDSSKYTESLKLGIVSAQTVYHLTGLIQQLGNLLGIPDLPAEIITHPVNVFSAEIDVQYILDHLPPFVSAYKIVSQYPPVIEDINVNYSEYPGAYEKIIHKIKSLSDLINQIELIDKYGSKLTLRITYHSDKKQLSSDDIIPIRQKISNLSPET